MDKQQNLPPVKAQLTAAPWHSGQLQQEFYQDGEREDYTEEKLPPQTLHFKTDGTFEQHFHQLEPPESLACGRWEVSDDGRQLTLFAGTPDTFTFKIEVLKYGKLQLTYEVDEFAELPDQAAGVRSLSRLHYQH